MMARAARGRHTVSMRRTLPLLGALALLAAAASAQPRPRPAPSVHYTVRADPALEHLNVEVCFDRTPPARLGPGISGAGRALEGAWARRRRLPVVEDRIVLEGLSAGDCARYRVDVDAALRASGLGLRVGTDIVASQGAWLWRDRARVPAGGATIRFALPDGLRAATPWPRRDGRQWLGPSAFRRAGFVAIGRFDTRAVERASGRARLVMLGDGWSLDADEAAGWLARAMDGVATVQGRFPVDDLLVILVPQPGRGMGFGMVRRGGGYAIAFLVGRESSAEDIARSWVSWHELSHLYLPALPREDAWLYEGLATYYQEVLPARAGVQSDEDAWDDLSDGFARGERGRRRYGPLGEEAARMRQTGAFTHVYWSGTAFALESDVALRRRGSSLDAALRRGGARWRGDQREWSSQEVCALWDRGLDGRVLEPLRDRYAGRSDFPATAALLRRLGVRRESQGVVLGAGELAETRDAIMRAAADARSTPRRATP